MKCEQCTGHLKQVCLIVFFLNSNGVVNERCRIQEECAEAKANQPGLHLLAGGNRLDSVIVFLSVCM